MVFEGRIRGLLTFCRKGLMESPCSVKLVYTDLCCCISLGVKTAMIVKESNHPSKVVTKFTAEQVGCDSSDREWHETWGMHLILSSSNQKGTICGPWQRKGKKTSLSENESEIKMEEVGVGGNNGVLR